MYNLDLLIKQSKLRIDDHIDMLYIQAKSKFNPNLKKGSSKKIDEPLLIEYLKKRGYITNNILGRKVMTKGFVCSEIHDSNVEIWHDIHSKSKSLFINESVLTGLPISLNYMEQI